jgi:hypothetical protein
MALGPAHRFEEGIAMKRWNRTVVGGLAAASVALLAGAAVSSASPSSIGTFTLAGQSKGTLIIAQGRTCKADNISISKGVATVKLYFNDTSIKPTSGLWYVLISSKGSEARYPSANATFAFGVRSGGSVVDQWSAGATSGTGSVTFTDSYKSGTLNVKLEPSAGQKGATRPEAIAGTWVCKK